MGSSHSSTSSVALGQQEEKKPAPPGQGVKRATHPDSDPVEPSNKRQKV